MYIALLKVRVQSLEYKVFHVHCTVKTSHFFFDGEVEEGFAFCGCTLVWEDTDTADLLSLSMREGGREGRREGGRKAGKESGVTQLLSLTPHKV